MLKWSVVAMGMRKVVTTGKLRAGRAVGCSDGFKVMTFDTRDEQKVAVMVVLKADARAD